MSSAQAEKCKCCMIPSCFEMLQIDEGIKKAFHEIIQKYELSDGSICTSCSAMLKTFTRFKFNITKKHDTLEAVKMLQKPKSQFRLPFQRVDRIPVVKVIAMDVDPMSLLNLDVPVTFEPMEAVEIKQEPPIEIEDVILPQEKSLSPPPVKRFRITTVQIQPNSQRKVINRVIVVPIDPTSSISSFVQAKFPQHRVIRAIDSPKITVMNPQKLQVMSKTPQVENKPSVTLKTHDARLNLKTKLLESLKANVNRKSELYRFKILDHSSPLPRISVSTPKIIVLPRKEKLAYICDQCNYQSANRLAFMRHFRLWHIKTDVLNKLFPCHVCHVTFTTNLKLIVHQNTKHMDRSEYTCINCFSIFSSAKLMREHQRNFNCYDRFKTVYHQESEKILCNLCGKMICKYKMKQHISTVHNKEKSYQCATCGIFFVASASLRDHYLIKHSEATAELQCDLCPEHYISKRNLISHMRRKHLPRMFKIRCKLCLKGFTTETDLKKHMGRVHRPGEIEDGIKANKRTNNFHCLRCSAQYDRKMDIVKHLQRCKEKLE